MAEGNKQKLWGIILAGGDGTRVQAFLRQLCGGRGIKQFCTILGRRSLLEQTLARVEQIIPRERILIVVGQHHHDEASRQLAQWPAENIIWQPANCDTAPGILLPLAHLSHRAPFATVAVFPSDHFIQDEARFLHSVQQAVGETQRFPRELTLLGATPDRMEEGYGWIEPGPAEIGRETLPVRRFWEKPPASVAHSLLRRGAVWNTFVFTAQAATLWEMTRQTAPDLYTEFMHIRRALSLSHGATVIDTVYRTLPSVNFSANICQPLAARLRVLRMPEIGWSDWGTQERILDSLRQFGRLDEWQAAPAAQRATNAIAALRLQQATGENTL